MNSPNNNYISLSLNKKNWINIILLIVLFNILSVGFSQEINPNGRNIFYFDNGRIASEGLFKNNLPEGIWKSYYSDGTLKSIGKKLNGLSDSTWIFFDNEGRKQQLFEYYLDKKNGCAIIFDTLGNIHQELFYVNDVIQGEIQSYHTDGSLKSYVRVIDGKKVGQFLEYDTSGVIITEEIYDNGFLKERNEYNRFNENGLKEGKWRTYFPNGTLQSESIYKNGEKNGLSKTYDKKGKLIDIQKMAGDSIAGNSDKIVIIEMYKAYYPDGKLKLLGGIDNGLKSGIFREYDKSGAIINGFIYKLDTLIAEGIILGNGIYEGEWKYFYPDYTLKSTGSFVAGKKEGKWVYYYPNGRKEQEGVFKDDLLKGSWTWYYPNGGIKRKEFYNNRAELEGTVYEYDSLGNEITRGDYYNGLREGEWFYHVGDYKEVGSYTLGLENGIWKHYYQNGKIAFIGNYNEGEPKGKHIYYHKNGLKKKVGKYLGGAKNGKWKEYNNRGEEIQTIEYKRGIIYKIDGFEVGEIKEIK
jgi:antitoxin component YwqK of YwqJK toxin-antitoxin module